MKISLVKHTKILSDYGYKVFDIRGTEKEELDGYSIL
jgi:hypothetical protein